MDGLLDTLRRLLGQPLGAADRRRVAAICIGAMAVVALLLSTLRSGPAVREPLDRRAEVVVPDASTTPAPTRDPAAVAVPDEGEGEPASAAEIAAAKRAARAFLRAYLPLTGGRGDVDDLTHLSDDLRAELTRSPPRPASTWAPDRRPPEVQSMQVTGSSPERLGLLVLAVDGDLPISFGLGLARYAEGWLVTDLDA